MRDAVALTPQDEFPHIPPDPCPPRWQENCFLLGWDDHRAAGVYLHVARDPEGVTQEVKAAVLEGDTATLGAWTETLTTEYSTPGLTIDVVEPWRRLHVSVDGKGVATVGPGAFLAEEPATKIPFSFDIVVESDLPPIDWHEALTTLGAPTERDHYEVACRWSGTLVAADRRLKASGLMVRDHTWGPREYSNIASAWWTPCCFDDAHAYLTGVSVKVDDRWSGVSIVVEEGKAPVVVPGHRVDLLEGDTPAVHGYRGATIVAGAGSDAETPLRAVTRVHVPVRYPEMADGFFMNDAYSMIEWGHRRGFGTVEMTGLSPRR